MFHVIEIKMRWRRENGLPERFDAMKNVKPIVAMNTDKPLNDQTMLADYFRMCHVLIIRFLMSAHDWQDWAINGIDDLGGIHETVLHSLFPSNLLFPIGRVTQTSASSSQQSGRYMEISLWSFFFKYTFYIRRRDHHSCSIQNVVCFFTFFTTEFHLEILRIFFENSLNIIIIVVIDLFINSIFVAAENSTTFFCVKVVLVMNDVIFCFNNIIFVEKFNVLTNTYVVVRVFALISPDSTNIMSFVSSSTVSIDRNVILSFCSFSYYSFKHVFDDRILHLILFFFDLITLHIFRQNEFVVKTSNLVKNDSFFTK